MSKPCGISIAILGTDGSGKTTVAGLLEQLFRQQGFGVRRLHWRPEILPSPIRSYGSPELVHDVTRPHSSEARSRVASILLMLYYLVDFWLGYVFQTRLFLRGRTSVAIFERYFYDVIIDPKRYRLTSVRTIERLLQRLAPPISIIIVLYGDPGVIFERKCEISLQEISRQQELIFAMFADTPNVTFLNVTSAPPAVIAGDIFQIAKSSLSRDDADTDER